MASRTRSSSSAIASTLTSALASALGCAPAWSSRDATRRTCRPSIPLITPTLSPRQWQTSSRPNGARGRSTGRWRARGCTGTRRWTTSQPRRPAWPRSPRPGKAAARTTLRRVAICLAARAPSGARSRSVSGPSRAAIWCTRRRCASEHTSRSSGRCAPSSRPRSTRPLAPSRQRTSRWPSRSLASLGASPRRLAPPCAAASAIQHPCGSASAILSPK
mmetsp:Transcript_50642/g.164115  ORF Transcript_50642/g.164115 Transcript_50642/m.164115 type:complete len:218 (+) Transcript_50642:879-1532(+)